MLPAPSARIGKAATAFACWRDDSGRAGAPARGCGADLLVLVARVGGGALQGRVHLFVVPSIHKMKPATLSRPSAAAFRGIGKARDVGVIVTLAIKLFPSSGRNAAAQTRCL